MGTHFQNIVAFLSIIHGYHREKKEKSQNFLNIEDESDRKLLAVAKEKGVYLARKVKSANNVF